MPFQLLFVFRVIQDAHLYLGPRFAQLTRSNPSYREVALQYHQNIDLFSEKVDVVVADINIFNWYNRDPRVTQTVDTTKKVNYHKIFKPTSYRVAFRNPNVRDAFNSALAELRSSGRYKAIVDMYQIKE